MRKLPKFIKEHVSNAEYYLEAADRFPPPTKDAVHILLLIIGWENIAMADEELRAWARKENVEKEVYKSHVKKLQNLPEVTRVVLDPTGKAREMNFSTGKRLEKLREICQYGSGSEVDIKRLFYRGWYPDTLRNRLAAKIDWMKTVTNAYEQLEKRRG